MTNPPAIDSAAEHAYVSGQGRPHWPDLIASFVARSEVTAARDDVRLDLPYGPHPRQTYDLVPASAPARGTLIYLHPGYWQMRDKAQFRFLGEVFGAMGFDTVIANYPLAPDRGVTEITEAVRALVPVARDDTRARHGRDLPLVAAGHSAGAHLAVELALTDPAQWGLPISPIAAVLALSGVYDLEPLVETSLNAKLALTPETARAASPVHRAERAACPALFVVGAAETPAFLAQNRDMAAAWRRIGAAAIEREEPEADHFTLIARLADEKTALSNAVATFLNAPHQPHRPRVLDQDDPITAA